MKFQVVALLAVFGQARFCLAASNLSLPKFSSLVVFGDSYTDDGVYSYAAGPGTQKTVASSGGRIWAQYVQQYARINLYDYAVSGAVCLVAESNTKRSGVKDNQVPTFLIDTVSNTTLGPSLVNPPNETVYAIWIGTNDLGYGSFLAEVQPRGWPITNYTNCVYSQLDRLYAAGARHFVLLNNAPLDLTPQYALPQNGGVGNTGYWKDKLTYDANITRTSEKMREYVALVNQIFYMQTGYSAAVGRYKGSTLAVFDVHSLITDIWNRPASYLNGTVAFNVTGSVVGCGSACSSGAVRDSYMWYDTLHPSEQTQRILAREFVKVVSSAGSAWATYF